MQIKKEGFKERESEREWGREMQKENEEKDKLLKERFIIQKVNERE